MNAPLAAAVLLAVSLTSCATEQTEKRNVIAAVVAHPDDEAAVAQLLVKYAKTNKVYVIIALDGRYGVKPGFPTGDALVKLRQTESQCASKILGAQPPIFLGFTDAFDSRELSMEGIGNYFADSAKLARKVPSLLSRVAAERRREVEEEHWPRLEHGCSPVSERLHRLH